MKILKPKYYLNKKLKPKRLGSVDTYPVYFRFTIGKNNHRIKSFMIGYLEDEDDLKNLRYQTQLETEALNYLYTRFHNYSFDKFNDDAYYLCSPVEHLVEQYMLLYVEEFVNQVAIEVYKDELKAYISSKTELPLGFLDRSITKIKFKSKPLPSDFIKDKKLKVIVDSYNECLRFKENEYRSMTMYLWFDGNIKKFFSDNYGSANAEFIDKVLNSFSKNLNADFVPF